MKKTNLLMKLVCLAAVSLMIISCGKKDDYRNALPADSFVTLSFDLDRLGEKADVSDFNQTALYKKAVSELSNSDELTPQQRQYVLDILGDASKTGIDIKEKLYFFVQMPGVMRDGSDFELGFLAKIKDSEEYDNFISFITNINDVNPGNSTEKGYTISFLSDGQKQDVISIHDGDKALILITDKGSDLAAERAKELFTQKRQHSLMADKKVASKLDKASDISMYMSFAGMPAEIKRQMNMAPFGSILSDIAMVSNTDFEKGIIESDFDVIFRTKDAEKKYKELYSYVKPVKGDLSKYVSPDAMMSFVFGLNGSKLYDMLANNSSYGMMMAAVPQIKEMLSAIDGDLVMELKEVGVDNSVGASMLVNVNNESVLSDLLSQLPMVPFRQTGENSYYYDTGDMNVYFGITNNVLYASTESSIPDRLRTGEGFANNGLEKISKGKQGAFLMNVAPMRNLYLETISRKKYRDTDEEAIAFALLGMFESLYFYANEDHTAYLAVEMTDKERNSLKVIYGGVVELFEMMILREEIE